MLQLTTMHRCKMMTISKQVLSTYNHSMLLLIIDRSCSATFAPTIRTHEKSNRIPTFLIKLFPVSSGIVEPCCPGRSTASREAKPKSTLPTARGPVRGSTGIARNYFPSSASSTVVIRNAGHQWHRFGLTSVIARSSPQYFRLQAVQCDPIQVLQ